jgi:hypothetical protein
MKNKGLAEQYNKCLVIMLNDKFLVSTVYSEHFEIPTILDNYAKLYQFDRSELKGVPLTMIETPKLKLHDVLDGKVSLPTDYLWTYRHYRVMITKFDDETVWFQDRLGRIYKKSRFHCHVNFME